MTAQHLKWLLLGALTSSAQAQVPELANAQWQALYEARQFSQLEMQAQTYSRAHENDPQAVLALALAADSDAEKGMAVLALAQRCVEQTPKAALCHFASGMLMSQQIANGGPLTAIRYGASIGQEFEQAVHLQPAYLPARSALIQFFLNAPRIAGGSPDKARDAAKATPPEQIEYAKILRGQIAMYDDKIDLASQEFRAVNVGNDGQLTRMARMARMGLGQALIREKQWDKAKPVFAELVRDFPERAEGYYGLGRCALQTDDINGAIAQFEQAQKRKGAELLPVDQRLGEAYVAKGDKQKAKTLLERFLKQPGMLKGNIDSAKKLLTELG